MIENRSHNPLLPIKWHIPDVEARVMTNGKLYLFGSYDEKKEQFCSTVYYTACTKNFIEWKIEGPIFYNDQVDWGGESEVYSSLSAVKSFEDLPEHIKNKLPENAKNIPIEEIIKAVEKNSKKNIPDEILLYAPDVIEKEGKYYLYMCCSDNTEGVALANCPNGPYENAVKLPVKGIDPAVFIDDDGQGYYYWGQFKSNVAKLKDDMMSIDMTSVVEGVLTEKEHHFHEGSSIRKRNGLYYYIFADISRGKPTCLGYAIGKNPMGPFVYQGVIIDNKGCDPHSWNNHGSIEEFNGKWYVFYHKSSGNSESMRHVCAEEISFDEDGKISEVQMTSQGVGPCFLVDEEIPAYSACEVFGEAYTDIIEENGCMVIECENSGFYVRYVKLDERVNGILIRGTGDAWIEIWSKDERIGQGELSKEIIPISVKAGIHEIKLVLKKVKNVKIEYLKFIDKRIYLTNHTS